MTILLVAILPALAVLLIAGLTGSRFWTWVSAFAASAVGVFTGQPVFMVLDLAAVAFAMWVSLASLKGRSPRMEQPAPQPAPVKENTTEGIGPTVLIGLIAVVAIGFKVFSPSPQSPVTKQTQPAPPAPPVKPIPNPQTVKAKTAAERVSQQSPSRVTPTLTQERRPVPPKPVPRPNSSTPLEQCLSIPSEAGMNRCLERVN